MARKFIIGGASMGLSALVAALLMSTPLPKQHPAVKVPELLRQQAPAAKPLVRNRSIILPAPPKLAPASSIRALQPKAKEETKTHSRTLNVQPLRPSQVKTTASQVAKTKPVLTRKSAPTVKPQQSLATDTVSAITDPVDAATQGRVLLRLLEHGSGPAIELAWPQDAAERAELYRRFRDCLGMRVALSRRVGELFVAKSPPGQNWQLNGDRYSAFARQPTGRLTTAEREDLRAIARRHGLSPRSPALRIFPRQVDAQLLGGLDRILAGGYGRSKQIRARYYLRKHTILLRDIQVDGRPIAGSVALRSSCGGS
ncbi:MAG: hypothetical protein HOK21_25390 [Rhodospirillaceae bacterium]|nr:hypothetical protein [Rhodospirillaceae bacterium]MBT5527432.1 hypothetical protein [Rhodospirillaceae bacterium]MBT5880721.1 hypothetical protein [Rhodospirillaceae bacterium]MBT6983339.1 hypothetical protein [Rhodospirillaceae bacterium]